MGMLNSRTSIALTSFFRRCFTIILGGKSKN